ncbi:MAG: type II toxin-antitoxin system HipA family toxin [Acidimicrobiia bacterium]|nr:type II toxin-antitoxin system HipA family toxin [Acidimicrobiia bacterium]
MVDRLAVWLYGDVVALTEEERGRIRLTYTDAALERYPLGFPLLSLSLPLTAERYTDGVVRPFLDGLLPEGAPRRAVADDLNLKASDTFGLIQGLGRDCAGAVVIQSAGDPPPPLPTTAAAEQLTDADLAALVANLRTAPLGIADRVRISLAGVQEKLVLTRMPDGSWGRPVDGTPSTHILKPELPEYPQTVENEAFCMRLAKHLQLDVASVETTSVDGRRLIVVERFDRIVRGDGSVERLHQQDFCQATGIPPVKKYQEDGGPSLRRVAAILQAVSTDEALDVLLRAVILNVLIGNGDAHGKNFSLLHEPSGTLRLAPLYDLLSTMHYGDDRLAMYIDDVRRTSRVTADRIINEAVAWGIVRRRAAEVVDDLLDRTPAAALSAQEDTDSVPTEIPQIIDRQFRQLRAGSKRA